MIVYCLLLTTLTFSLVSFIVLQYSGTRPLKTHWSLLLLAVSMAVVMELYGTWVFLSVYCKYIFGGGFFLVLIIALFRKKKVSRNLKKSTIIVSSILSAIFITLTLLYFTGTTGKPYGVINLTLPFKTGKYFVFQGGKGLPTNVFHYGGRRTVFAMDIIKLNKMQGRGRHIFSEKLEDYEIFNDTVYSPCDGVVLKTENNNPDNIPPDRKRGPTNLNQVLIESDSAFIFLGHLKQGAVFVKKGDKVFKGQQLGLVGNSGQSLEPHLHIQAHAKTGLNIPWYKQPQLLIEFDGKSYLLFEIIDAH